MKSMDRNDLRKIIEDEHGINYSKNVDVSGFVYYMGNSFIAFDLLELHGVMVARINYMFFENKEDMSNLIAWSIKLWKGYDVKMLYYKEHKRKANVDVKLLESWGLKKVENKRYNKWKHNWTSTNGFKESNIIEMFTE